MLVLSIAREHGETVEVNCASKALFSIFQSLSENELGVVGAMVVDEVLNTNTWLTHLNLSGNMIDIL